MTALLEEVLAQVSRMPETEQDAVAARLLQTLAEFDQVQRQKEKTPKRMAGTAKGSYWMSEDFAAPLEDFKEYM